MRGSRLDELAGFGGIAFVVLFLGGLVGAGDAGLENGAKIATYFADHRDRILVGYHIAGIGLLAFVIWSWWIMNVIERIDATARNLGLAVVTSASILAAVEFGVIALAMTLALISDQAVDPQVARAFANGAQVFSYVEYFPQALFFLAVGVALLRTRLVAPWLGWWAIALVPLSLIAAAPRLGIDVPAALLTFGWIVIASIAMIRSERLATPTASSR